MRVFVCLAIFAVASAHSSSNTSSNASPDPLTIIQFQQMMAQNYLQVILQFQKAQAQSLAASYFLQEAQERNNHGSVFPAHFGVWLEEDDEEADFEEDEEHLNPDNLRLLAAYYLFHANQIKLYETIITAPQVQQGYYLNRAIQLTSAAAGSNVPPQVAQALYLNSFNTNLKTLKLSYGLQYISHFRTWLEDEIDKEKGLLTQKQFAFQSFYAYALVDYQTFLLDMYVQQIIAQLSIPQQAASFLEEESSAESQTQFFPFMFGAALGAGANGFSTYSFFLTYYHRMLQLAAAQAGFTHVQLLTQLHEGQPGNTGHDLAKYADFSFTQWASSLQQASQVNFILAIFSMYSLYAPVQTPTAN